MANICSRHQRYEKDCKLCNSDVRDLFPDWNDKVAEAEAAGSVTCECGFEYYLTVNDCPMCGNVR